MNTQTAFHELDSEITAMVERLGTDLDIDSNDVDALIAPVNDALCRLETAIDNLVPAEARRRYRVVLNTDPAWHDFDRLWDVVDDTGTPIAQRMARWAAELLAGAVEGA